MPDTTHSALNLVVDGKVINVKTSHKMNFDLNKALLDSKNFQNFAQDPKGFAKNYHLDIDPDISNQLSKKLSGLNSLDDLVKIKGRGNEAEATIWAVAEGAYSVASTKVAVAF